MKSRGHRFFFTMQAENGAISEKTCERRVLLLGDVEDCGLRLEHAEGEGLGK